MAQIRPLRDQVFVSRLVEERSEGGLYIPQNAACPDVYLARVVAAGPKAHVAEGMKVLVSRFIGAEAEVAGVRGFFVDAKDLIAAVES